MLLKKTVKCWKNGLTINNKKIARIMLVFVVFGLTGCDIQKSEIDTSGEHDEIITETTVTEPEVLEAERIIEISYDLYKQAVEENSMADLGMIQSIVNRLGENGYVAVDSRNQIDMTETEQVMRFCEMVDEKKEAELVIVQVTYLGGFVEYDLHTKDGIVDVVRSYYKYEKDNIQKVVTGSYKAEYWNYTEEGYLMFSGAWYSEELYVLTLSGVEEHTALRVQPLDERCKELNRQYLLPIGYEQNNMFLVDWSEDNFGELNFYDLYDIFYPKMYSQNFPYVSDENLGVGAIYQIPKDEFENVIMKYISIDSKTLQSMTNYCEEGATYEYKPRGFYEVEYPDYPYSEVVDFMENNDGTITLIANVVFPNAGDSKVYSHEVIVRPLEDGGVQYVSNHIIQSDDNSEETWHTPRLTEEEWEEIYGGSE